MKHTLDELLDIVYRYYPRGVGMVDGDLDFRAIRDSEEHARLVAARRKAATDERWLAMLRRISQRFPGMLMNYSLGLPTGDRDACYSFTIDPPNATDRRTLWFHISFLAPYYLIHTHCLIEFVRQPDSFKVPFRGLQYFIKKSAAYPKLISNIEEERSKSVTVKQGHITFDLLPEEQPYADWIAREIETTFGCERMLPEVGTVLVPDVTTDGRLPGEARLYDCLFTSHHHWVNPSPSEAQAPSADVDESHLTEPFLAVLTVLAALHHILLPLMPETQGAFYWALDTDGVLHKEEVLQIVAKIRQLIDPPVTPRGLAFKRELEAATREVEALIAAWDGEGPPPDAMVAWASGFLANWLAVENSR